MLKNRLDKLTAVIRPTDRNPFMTCPLPELVARTAVVFDLPVGSLSRSPAEAYAKGHESMASELAATLGITGQELKELLWQR